jgi:hypothetical protein
MVSIRLADAKPPPTLLPTSFPATTNPVQPLLKMMDVLLTLHPDLQRVVDEQQPMWMDVLPALHPDPQQVVDEQLASSMPTPQPVDMLELQPPPPPILLEHDLIYKTEVVLLGPPPLPPPTAATASTAPLQEQPPSVLSPPAARVNMFAHTAEADGEAEVNLGCRMSVLISCVIISHLLKDDPSLHGFGQFCPSRSPTRRPRHHNSGPRSAATPARRVWRRQI